MQAIAKGTFQVAVTPRAAGEGPADLGRFVLTKTFEGGLVGSSAGEMLSAGNPASGSAGYVALEWFTGSLADREGRFALLHCGLMDRGEQRLSISVVPGSGAGGLQGLAGTLELQVVDGRHDYALHYELPD